jgi:outer membrane protein W
MKKYIIIAVFFMSGLSLSAQSLWNITYDMSVPLGDTKEIVDKVSFRGVGIDGRGFISKNVSVGGSFSWNTFYNSEENQTITEDNITITGNHYNYGNYVPLMVTSHYYFGEDGGVRTYVGAGAGTIWKEETIYVGSIQALFDNNWQFGFMPEVGIYIPVATSSLFFINAKYTYGVSTKNLNATSYINFGVGFAWENF